MPQVDDDSGEDDGSGRSGVASVGDRYGLAQMLSERTLDRRGRATAT